MGITGYSGRRVIRGVIAVVVELSLCSCGQRTYRRAAPPPIPAGAIWVRGTEAADVEQYQWLTPDRLFTLQPTKAEREPDGMWRVYGASLPTVVSTTGNQKRVLKNIRTLFNPSGLPTGDEAYWKLSRYWLASPDGKWLLFHTTRVADPSWWAASTDGKRLIRWTSPMLETSSLHGAVWMRDGHRWVELDHSVNQWLLRIYRLGAPKPETRLIHWGTSVNQMYYLSPNPLVLGFTPDGALITKGTANDSESTIFRITLGSKDAHGEALRRDQSRSVGLMDVALSPDGKRLAYRTSEQSLYVSDLDGGGEREVSAGPVQPASIRWTPDGRRISFGSGAALYTVPVDGVPKYRLEDNL